MSLNLVIGKLILFLRKTLLTNHPTFEKVVVVYENLHS